MNLLAPLPIAFLVGLFAVLFLGKPVIGWLAAAKARQPVSGDAPATHAVKQGTPTMGGLLILVAAALGALLASLIVHAVPDGDDFFCSVGPRGARLTAVALTFLLGGAVGFLDDLGKARKKQNKAGLSERAKLGCQVAVAVAFVAALAWINRNSPGFDGTIVGIRGHAWHLGTLYYVLAALFICGFGNAVNFTDGLDGLASGTTLIVCVGMAAALALTSDGPNVSGQLMLFYVALAGACAGFLWFNAHPAKVFMGDTGSLALGMGLAAAALAAKQEILLCIVGAVYLAEIAAMMIQRYVFKYRRIKHGLEYAQTHRVFRRAPLHHHFEELGVPETQVVARFWIATLIAAAIGILVAPYLVPGGGR